MSKRSLMLVLVLLYCACADPTMDPTQETGSPDAGREALEAEASVLVSDQEGGDVVTEVSTPGLERRLYAVPETAIVIPARLTEQLTAAALAKAGEGEKPRLVGVHVPLASLAPRWERLEGPGGPSWRLAIVSEDAAFLRPHFPAFPRSDEAEVFVYGASSDQRAARVTPTPTATSPDVWGPMVDGSVLFVEVVTASGEEPSLVVDVVSSGIPRARKAEDDCYLDPACYGYWKSTKSGVGQMIYEKSGGAFVCTGAMVIDKSKSFKPYFLTANHCISTQSVADSLVVSWKYQTSSCNGSVPNLNNVPHTFGSSVKVTNKSSDFTLLLLDKKPPSGTLYLGWNASASALGTGTDVTVIHHPDGAWKRISFADVAASVGNYWRVVYAQGSTEGGSSGSPLLLDSSKQIVGQLSKGNAACANMSGTDDYGKFSVSWTKGLSTYLNK